MTAKIILSILGTILVIIGIVIRIAIRKWYNEYDYDYFEENTEKLEKTETIRQAGKIISVVIIITGLLGVAVIFIA